jgi:hypothetical protein
VFISMFSNIDDVFKNHAIYIQKLQVFDLNKFIRASYPWL